VEVVEKYTLDGANTLLDERSIKSIRMNDGITIIMM